MKRAIKKIIPDFILSSWHYLNAWYGSVRYDHPSENMLVIGVTGTSGKSSTIHFLRQILEDLGYKVGSLSTIDFYINGKQKLNDRKMTMMGRGRIHKYLRKMLKDGCEVAIVETTSEGALQHRHKFINYDFVVLTNIYPEHIESHGSFENYKECKMEILRYISRCRRKYKCKKEGGWDIQHRKRTENECEKIPQTCFLNGNNEYTPEALEIDFEKKYVFARNDREQYGCEESGGKEVIISKNNEMNKDGISFGISGKEFSANLLGKHNIWNLLSSICVAKQLGADWEELKESVSSLDPAPGRIEFIQQAESHGFKVIVDYAFEPKALNALYNTIDVVEKNNIIHVCGATGGGRDKARREPIGKIAGQKADVVIVTNEDPYYEDPVSIIKSVSEGAKMVGKELGEDLFEIESREKAIEKALSLAEEGDLVLITGKGSEQGVVEDGKIIDWDDREVVRDKLKKI